MSNTATRLITLIMLLQRQPNQKAADLAAELGVSVRTLHRYFSMLDEMGIPVYSERGPYGGFSLVKGYRMPPLVFSHEEAVAVYLGASLVEEMWGQLYRRRRTGRWPSWITCCPTSSAARWPGPGAPCSRPACTVPTWLHWHPSGEAAPGGARAPPGADALPEPWAA